MKATTLKFIKIQSTRIHPRKPSFWTVSSAVKNHVRVHDTLDFIIASIYVLNSDFPALNKQPWQSRSHRLASANQDLCEKMPKLRSKSDKKWLSLHSARQQAASEVQADGKSWAVLQTLRRTEVSNVESLNATNGILTLKPSPCLDSKAENP